MRPIDTEDLCATGSFLEIGDVMVGKLLAQVEADHVELGYIAHVPFVYLSRYLLFNESPRLVFPAMPQSLLPVHVQPDFLLAVWNGHISFRRGNDGGLPRSRGSELFGQIDLDRQCCPFDGQLHVLHDVPSQ